LFLVLSPLSIALASDIPKKLFHLKERIEKDIGYWQALRIGNVLYILRFGWGREMPAAMRQFFLAFDAHLTGGKKLRQNVGTLYIIMKQSQLWANV
jgi:hypothetical protein